jgi:RNA polymerase sigma factor (sigma-70 family)
MCMVQEKADFGPAAFICAQSGCRACQERLLCTHEGLVHAVIRRSWVGATAYDDLLQEGRMGLWRAIRGYDVGRGTRFSTYAWPIIARQVWRTIREEERRRRAPPLPWAEPPDPEAFALAAWQADAIGAALESALGHLDPRSRDVIIAAYGLDGQGASSLAAIGRHYGISRERVRQLRNDGLFLLRLPAIAARLAVLTDQNDRQAYQQRQALNQRWLRRRPGRRVR